MIIPTKMQKSITSLLVASCILHIASAAHASLFRKTPAKQYMKLQGLNIELPCVTDQKDVNCFWLKDATIIVPTNKYQFTQNSRDGDCSLMIHNLQHPQDSSKWTCQVQTAGTIHDIQWPNTSVVVLVKPSPPKIQYDKLNSAITAESKSNLTCVSRGGNPVPLLQWNLNGDNITQNATIRVRDNVAYSTLNYSFRKLNNGSTLSCISVHPTGDQSDSQVLDVLYKPHVSVRQKVYTVPDGQSLEIDCFVDSNPPTNAYWKPNVAINANKHRVSGNKLILANVDHTMDGVVFQCSAQNSVGTSEPESVKLNVLYDPRLSGSSPLNHKITLGGDIRLECNFVGNPKPIIRWAFIDSIKKELVYLPSEPENVGLLLVKNATYTNEGGYYCEAVNYNSQLNKEIIIRSNKFEVDIVGKPSFIEEKKTVIGYRGLNTRVEQTFCSDPFPTNVYWQYGSMHIDVSLDLKPATTEEFTDDHVDEFHIKAGRLVNIDPLSPKPTCFSAALMIANTDIDDKRNYVLVVKNLHGISEGTVTLQVNTHLSVAIMISISLIVLLMLFIISVTVILVLRRRSTASATNGHASLEVESQKPENGGSFL